MGPSLAERAKQPPNATGSLAKPARARRVSDQRLFAWVASQSASAEAILTKSTFQCTELAGGRGGAFGASMQICARVHGKP